MHAFLNNCHKIEDLARKIYQQLASCSDFAPEVRQVFQKLSDDERSHALHLDLLQQSTDPHLDASPMMSFDKLEQAVTLAEQFFSAANRRLDEGQALQLAVQMEQQFIKVHAHNIMHFGNPRLAALFEELGKADQEHVDALQECLNWWHAKREPRHR